MRPTSPQNLFLSHAWAPDLRGRSTHHRAAALRSELQRLGWKIWFDEDRLLAGEPLDAQLASGISQSDAVCICVTRKYCEKVNAATTSDNVYKEWNFCQAVGKKMIPLIFEEEMRDVKAWPSGIMSMVLGNTFYIDASSDDIRAVATRLSKMLVLLGLQPKSRASSWPRSHRTDSRRLLRARTEIRI